MKKAKFPVRVVKYVEKAKFPVMVVKYVDSQYIDDVMCSALEGGICYWAESAIPVDGDYKGREFASEIISRGGMLLIKEEEEGDTHLLTLLKFLNGVSAAVSKFGTDCLDAGYVDAGIADYIIQMALFDEIIYG